jgi:hypothetical protein
MKWFLIGVFIHIAFILYVLGVHAGSFWADGRSAWGIIIYDFPVSWLYAHGGSRLLTIDSLVIGSLYWGGLFYVVSRGVLFFTKR